MWWVCCGGNSETFSIKCVTCLSTSSFTADSRTLYRSPFRYTSSRSRPSQHRGDQKNPGFLRSRNKVSAAGLRAAQFCKKWGSRPGFTFHVSTVQTGTLNILLRLLRPEFFSTPAYDFRRKYRTIRCQCDFVGVEVRSLAWARPVETAHYLSLRVDFQDACGNGVAHIQEVIRGDHQTERMPKVPLP